MKLLSFVTEWNGNFSTLRKYLFSDTVSELSWSIHKKYHQNLLQSLKCCLQIPSDSVKGFGFVVEEFSELEHSIECSPLVGLTGTVFKIPHTQQSEIVSFRSTKNLHWDLQSIFVKKLRVYNIGYLSQVIILPAVIFLAQKLSAARAMTTH